ncbi:CD1375 family protein [Terrisporobacter sp.]
MASIYRNLIIKKLKTIDDVPVTYKEDVLTLLKEKGLDGYGNPLV